MIVFSRACTDAEKRIIRECLRDLERIRIKLDDDVAAQIDAAAPGTVVHGEANERMSDVCAILHDLLVDEDDDGAE